MNTMITDAMIRNEAVKSGNGNGLAQRGRGLEEAYFAEENRRAVEKLKGVKKDGCCGGKCKDCSNCCGACKS